MTQNPGNDGDTDSFETLKRERDRFVALAFCAADVLLEVNARFEVTYAAGATKALTDSTPEKLLGRSLLDLLEERDRPLLSELIRKMTVGRRLDPVCIRLNRGQRRSVPLLLTGYHLPELPNSFFFALRLGSGAAGADTERWPRDDTSGLLLREPFGEAAAARLREGKAHGEELMLTMLRLTDFVGLRSRLNEEASQSLQNTVGACLRVGSGAQETAAQFDDENFGLIHKHDLDVEEMRNRIELQTRSADPTGAGIAVKSGTVSTSLPDVTEEDHIKALLYTVNQFCQDRREVPSVATLSENMEQMLGTASRKMTQFREIVSAENFDVAFQPIVAIHNREIHHYEALARFGGGSNQSPYELITFAEDTGLISDFDFAMVRKLLTWIMKSNAAGKRYIIACNLSGRSIGKPAFLSALQELLQKHKDVRTQLVIEITESARIADLTAANNFIQSLRRAGHTVCLDDFGAGASALKYLHEMDVDIVKIDGHYIQGAVTERKVRPFLRAIAGLCGELGIVTVAEMVENDETVKLLKDCRIELAQGFLFGRPNTDITVFEDTPGSGRPRIGAPARRPAAAGR